jgi:hypothetical protein
VTSVSCSLATLTTSKDSPSPWSAREKRQPPARRVPVRAEVGRHFAPRAERTSRDVDHSGRSFPVTRLAG